MRIELAVLLMSTLCLFSYKKKKKKINVATNLIIQLNSGARRLQPGQKSTVVGRLLPSRER